MRGQFVGKWDRIYSRPVGSDDIAGYMANHRPFLEAVSALKPRRVLEVGAGSGRFSIHLSRCGIEAVACDNDPGVAAVARAGNRRARGSAGVLLADGFRLPFRGGAFDAVISQGLMEHFADGDIRLLLDEQLRVAKSAVFSVPSKYYPWREFGNERLMNEREWRRILHGYTIVCFTPYDFHRVWFHTKRRLDYYLYFLQRRPRMFSFTVTGKR